MYQNIFLCHPEIPSLGVLVLFPTTTTTFFFWVHDHYHFFLCHPEIRHSASWRFFQPQQQPFFSGSMITIIFFNVIRRFVTRRHEDFSNHNSNLFFLGPWSLSFFLMSSGDSSLGLIVLYPTTTTTFFFYISSCLIRICGPKKGIPGTKLE
jgi:hypothetical protein